MDSNTIGLSAVIIGPKGLRAGWRLLIFLPMLVAMGAVARAIIIRFLIPAGFAPEKFTPSSVAVPVMMRTEVPAIRSVPAALPSAMPWILPPAIVAPLV